MQFFEKLSKLRKANNLSQEQLAEKLNVTRQAVSKWESGESYPDMAKIIQLCKILNCSLNDIMDDGLMGEIVEEKKEEEKKSYFNDFLDYVTKTYNMFIHMTLKSKIILLLELCFIAFIIFCIAALVYLGLSFIIDLFVTIIPGIVGYTIRRILETLIMALLIVLGVIVFLHLFKIRYLDYYVTITDKNSLEQTIEEPIKDNKQESELVSNKNPKIIIRDPAHSSNRFFSALADIFIFLIKCMVIILVIPVVIAFIFGVAAIVFCLIQKANIFFYFAFSILGLLLLAYIIIHFAYNFIFKLKQPYRIFLAVFLTGLVVFGIGAGLSTNSILQLKRENTEYEMTALYKEHINPDENKNIAFDPYQNVEYVIDDSVKGIDIEIKHPENCDVKKYWYYNNDKYVFSYYLSENSLYMINQTIDDLKNGVYKDGYYNYGFEIKVTCSNKTYEEVFK